jgi:hypothetical protein
MHQLQHIWPDCCNTNPCFPGGKLAAVEESTSVLCIQSAHQCPPESSVMAEPDSQTAILLSVNMFPVTTANDEACKLYFITALVIKNL